MAHPPLPISPRNLPLSLLLVFPNPKLFLPKSQAPRTDRSIQRGRRRWRARRRAGSSWAAFRGRPTSASSRRPSAASARSSSLRYPTQPAVRRLR
uniref:Uncharacterized protein n=1 Tax=Arundo donax TaxID=35708 RepID=A0A0A8ZU26_ARUDO